MPVHFAVQDRQFEAKSNWFGMNAMGAADHRGMTMLQGASLERIQQLDQPFANKQSRLFEQQTKRSVHDVIRSKTPVDEPRVLPYKFSHGCSKCDDIVAGDFFNLVDTFRIKSSSRPDAFHAFGWDDSPFSPCLANG